MQTTWRSSRVEVRQRGISLAQVLRELVAREARELRRTRRPRFGIVHGDGRATATIAADEDAPARDSGPLRVTLVLDTGPIVALLDADDPEHEACRAMVEKTNEDLVVPAPVLVAVDYWLRKLFGPEPWRTFVEDIAGGAYRLHQIDEDQLVRAAELEAEYASLSLGFVDAAVVATCERLAETEVATLDRRRFALVRPQHCRSLELLPASRPAK